MVNDSRDNLIYTRFLSLHLQNLKAWKHLSDFGPAAEVGGCWECPDLFQLGEKWILDSFT